MCACASTEFYDVKGILSSRLQTRFVILFLDCTFDKGKLMRNQAPRQSFRLFEEKLGSAACSPSLFWANKSSANKTLFAPSVLCLVVYMDIGCDINTTYFQFCWKCLCHFKHSLLVPPHFRVLRWKTLSEMCLDKNIKRNVFLMVIISNGNEIIVNMSSCHFTLYGPTNRNVSPD